MKRILVIGAAGEVGEGIVRELLEAGNQVIARSRSRDRLEELSARIGDSPRLILSEGPAELLDSEIDGVVASIGSWWSGPRLIDLDLVTYEKVMADRLTSHFLAAKAHIPALMDRPGTSYLFIHGASGFIPIPGSGPVSIAGAAQVMLKDVFAAELESKPIRINLLSMMSSIATRSHPANDAEAITASDVGRYAAYLVSNAASSIKGQTIKFTHRREIPL